MTEQINMMKRVSFCINKKKVLALCSVYNRVNVTKNGLKSLETAFRESGYKYDICVVDDGSTDSTVESLKQNFDKINILKLSGGQYWARSMRLGFEEYWDTEKYFALLVFNDDCLFFRESIKIMLDRFKEYAERGLNDFIIVGTTCDPLDHTTTYGGWQKKSKWFWAGLKLKEIGNEDPNMDTFNMNCALINCSVIDKHGFIDPEFVHGMADFDYGLRLSSFGVIIHVLPNYVAFCSRNSTENTWMDSSVGLFRRFKNLNSVKNLPAKQNIFFLKRHAGLLWVLFFIYPYLKILLTSLFHSLKQIFFFISGRPTKIRHRLRLKTTGKDCQCSAANQSFKNS